MPRLPLNVARTLVCAPLVAAVVSGCSFGWMRPRYPTQRKIERAERAHTDSASVGGRAKLPGGRDYVPWPETGGHVVTGDDDSVTFWIETRDEQRTLTLIVRASGCRGFGYRPYSNLRPVRQRVAEAERGHGSVELRITEADGASSTEYATAAMADLRCDMGQEQISARFWAKFDLGEVSGWGTTSAEWEDYVRPE